VHTQIHRSNFRKREIFPNIGHSPSHPSAAMSGQSPRSWNLPGSFSEFLAESRNSEIDPEADIAPQGVSPANFYQSLQQMPCWIGGHGTVP